MMNLSTKKTDLSKSKNANLIPFPGTTKEEWTEKVITYQYTCKVCGNSFKKNHQCDPRFCRECEEPSIFKQTITKSMEQLSCTYQQCPICCENFETSDYLNETFKDEHVRWLANMVTHYRHGHIKSWDKTWSRGSYGWNQLSEWTYDQEKLKVNERAKRQILRKCKDFMIENGFTVEHVKKLQNTDSETIKLYEKILGKTQNKINN